MKWIKKSIRKLKKKAINYYKPILTTELFTIFMSGKPVHAAPFTPPQNFLDGVQWIILGGQFLCVVYAAVKLFPVGWAFISNRQQKVEEGKDGVMNIAIGVAIVFVGLWALKMYVESIGGTYPLPI